MTKLFASDNSAPVHPQILSDLAGLKDDHVYSYGADELTHQADTLFAGLFGCNSGSILTTYTANGTGANVIGISSFLEPWEGVIGTFESHITEDECGALEGLRGIKIYHREGEQGKLSATDIEHYRGYQDNIHRNRPAAVSITQATEIGTTYDPEEIRSICRAAQEQQMLVHLDGARLANAVVAHVHSQHPQLTPDSPEFLSAAVQALREMTREAGVGVVSLGLSKNGGMLGEVLVVFPENLPQRYQSLGDKAMLRTKIMRSQKQAMQLISKTRYIVSQAVSLFSGDLWVRNAWNANLAAQELGQGIASIIKKHPGCGMQIDYPVQANGVWLILPKKWIEPLRERFGFYTWDAHRRVIRLMCSWDTSRERVHELLDALTELAHVN